MTIILKLKGSTNRLQAKLGANNRIAVRISSDDLARKILNAFTNVENLTNMGVEAKRMIVDQFSLDSIGKQYVNIYSRVLKEGV